MKFCLISDEVRERVVKAVINAPDGYEVTIRARKSKRSLDQNALYWKWIDAIRMHVADSTGQIFSADDMHEWLKAKFLPSRVVEVGGEKIRCRHSTTKLSVKEMAEYLERIDGFCADSLHLILPTRDLE